MPRHGTCNGTFLNGKRIHGRHELKALDVIRIGAEEFRYYPAAARRAPAPSAPAGAEFRLGDTLVGFPSMPPMRPPPAATAPPVLASLLVKRGERKGDRLSVRTAVAHLGRGEFNDVRLSDASISASHAKLQLREGVWVIADLGSTNGTFVDDIPVDDETALSPGCTVRLGEVALLFEPLDEGTSKPVGTVVLPKAAAGAARHPETRTAPALAPARAGSITPSRMLWRGIAIVVLLGALAALILLT
jgi:pSer/pThr/pTyr-binding forkhead associated (FHA) protein